MGHKTLINGTAYNISGGKTLIGGTSYDISGGKTLIGGTGYNISFSPYKPVFADNSWTQIIQACQNNEVPDTWTVGSSKYMYISGTGNCLIDIIGKNHDVYYGGSKPVPLTFQAHYLWGFYSMNPSNSNTSGWQNSDMRQSTLLTILNQMPTEVSEYIKYVTKVVYGGGADLGCYQVSDRLFLLSEAEVFGTVTYSRGYEGTQYAYYTSASNRIKKTTTGSVSNWWLRSPRNGDQNQFCVVAPNGDPDHNNAFASNYAPIAFCF